MSIAVLFCMTLMADLGPLDAFRANYSAIRAGVTYEFESGVINSTHIRSPRFWEDGRPEVRKSRTVIHGRWECDGTTEYYLVNPQAWDHRPVTDVMPGTLVQIPVESVAAEMLSRDRTVAWHGPNRKAIDVFLGRDRPPVLLKGISPFYWWGPQPFPRKLEVAFPMGRTGLRRTEWDGNLVEVETYHESYPETNGWYQVEMAYDPSIGYLPRYGRATSSNGRGVVFYELYLVEAIPCHTGGFIPTEWYETSFGYTKVGDPSEYRIEQPLEPRGEIYLGHFRATKVENIDGPIAFKKLDDVDVIAATGGQVPLPKGTRELTLDRIRAMLGSKLTNPIHQPMISVDYDELGKYNQRSSASWPRYLLLATTFTVLLVLTVFFVRRARAICLLAFLLNGTGCGPGPAQEPMVAPRLSASFVKATLLFESPVIDTKLVLRNGGNDTIRVFEVDGGCACRKIEQEVFPFALDSGEARSIGVSLSDRGSYGPQQFTLTIETNHGLISVPASLSLLSRHQFSPDSLTFEGIEEGRAKSFELVHRVIYSTDEPKPETDLISPPSLSVERIGIDAGVVAFDPGYRYEEATYRVSLLDRELGLHKAEIRLQGSDGRALREVPVVWRRVPFLHSAPDRVFLGARPIRVFLRCPDERVELTRILSAPEGVTAVVSSVRELTVMLDDEAPGIIDGTIEVGTTAEDRPPLRVPVVRYAPALAQNPEAG